MEILAKPTKNMEIKVSFVGLIDVLYRVYLDKNVYITNGGSLVIMFWGRCLSISVLSLILLNILDVGFGSIC